MAMLMSIGHLAHAQLRVNSPYTRFGLGNLYQNETGYSRLQGGISYGMRNNFSINTANPASLAAIDTSSFVIDVGYAGYLMESQSNTGSASSNYFNLDYLKAAFPVTKWWKTSLSLTPYSSVGYDVSSVSDIDSVGSVGINYLGDGGINRFNFGNAVLLQKNVSLGFNASYLFGTMNYRKETSIPDNENAYSFRLNNSYKVKSGYIDFGVQYTDTIFFEKKNKKELVSFTLGAVYGFSQDIRANSNSFGETFLETSGGYEYIKDTILEAANGEGSITIPAFYGAGFYFQKPGVWTFGADFKTQLWEQYSSFGNSDSLRNSMLVKLGGSYTIGRLTLMAGAHFYESYLSLNGNSINELGMTFGLAVPLFKDQQTKTFPMLTLGTEIGRRGLTNDGLIQEDYLKFFLGLSIKSNNWFNRRKYL
jgi:hypothetical protein